MKNPWLETEPQIFDDNKIYEKKETNLKVIQSIMGHRNIETTMDIYAEATDKKKKESFENLSVKLDVF